MGHGAGTGLSPSLSPSQPQIGGYNANLTRTESSVLGEQIGCDRETARVLMNNPSLNNDPDLAFSLIQALNDKMIEEFDLDEKPSADWEDAKSAAPHAASSPSKHEGIETSKPISSLISPGSPTTAEG